jgi:hypothetical protein
MSKVNKESAPQGANAEDQPAFSKLPTAFDSFISMTPIIKSDLNLCTTVLSSAPTGEDFSTGVK